MIEYLTAKFGVVALQYTAVGVSGVVVAWALKRVPNKAIKAKFGAFMYGAGVATTLGLSKFKWTKGLWNKTVEPYVIDAIDNIFVTGVSKFVEGMRSDG